MFGFHKKINQEEVNSYQNAIMVIDMYISSGSFNKAIVATDEILEKELEALTKFKNTIKKNQSAAFAKKEIEKEVEAFEKRRSKLLDLRDKAQRLEEAYIYKIEEENFKILLKNTKKQIKQLLKIKKPKEALTLLQNLLAKHKDNILAVNYYNKEKANIHKALEKQKAVLKKKLKHDAKAEAQLLLGKNNPEKIVVNEEKVSFIEKLKGLFSTKRSRLIQKVKNSIERDKIMREFNEILERNEVSNPATLRSRLENVHKGLIKEMYYDKLIGYDIYGKILGADKISGDTFGLEEKKDSYIFYLGDATGHGVRAGIIVSLLHKAFQKYRTLDFVEMVKEINNSLKQKLESRNFITGAFFEANTKDKTLNYIGLGHEPILVYSTKNKKVEKKVLGGLAAGIRLINDTKHLKKRELILQDKDILLVYSDGIVEAKNENNEFYGLDRLRKSFEYIAKIETDIQRIYTYLIEDVKLFHAGSKFLDDASIMLVKRNVNKDVIAHEDLYFDEIVQKQNLNKKELKLLEGRTKAEIQKKLDEIKHEKETKRIVDELKRTYYNGEILKLKHEAIRYIKDGYIHKDINKYLRKAIDQELEYKIDQKNQKMQNKYKVLEELYKKGDYETVIHESEEIIAKDGTL